MVSPYIKKLVRETGKSEREISQFWEKAKKITSETFGVKEDDFTTEHYEFAITTVKNMLGLSEEIVNPSNFLQSDLDAKNYIETVISGSLKIADKNPVIVTKNTQMINLKKYTKDKKDKKEKD